MTQTNTIAAIDRRPFESLGHADHGWLDARHHFSFANYHNPARMGWGAIRVWNDDTIAPNSGFPPHPHRDMEIITYVRSGAITHQDSLGNKGRTGAGDVQVMSAGSGVRHAEYNLESEPTTLFQIWIEPTERGLRPSYEQKQFADTEKRGRLRVVASPDGREGSVTIHADATLSAGLFDGAERAEVALDPARKAYVHLVRGELRVNGTPLTTGDAALLAYQLAWAPTVATTMFGVAYLFHREDG